MRTPFTSTYGESDDFAFRPLAAGCQDRRISRGNLMSKTKATLTFILAAASLYGQNTATQQRENQLLQQQAFEEQSKQQQQSSTSSSGAQAAPNSLTPAATPSLAPGVEPRKPGVFRIAVLAPKVQMGDGGTAVSMGIADVIRQTLQRDMTGPQFEVIAISAGLGTQIEAEARQKLCDYILTSSVTQKKGGGGFAKLMAVAGPATSMIPMVGMAGGMAGVIAGGTAMGAASGMSGMIHAKDEVTFEYAMLPLNGQAKLANSLKAKAKSAGEDVITPLLEQGATNILTWLAKPDTTTH